MIQAQGSILTTLHFLHILCLGPNKLQHYKTLQQLFTFFKRALPLQNSPLQNKEGNKFYGVIKGKIVFVIGQYKLILTDKAITEKKRL
jgi:hypothetical protein